MPFCMGGECPRQWRMEKRHVLAAVRILGTGQQVLEAGRKRAGCGAAATLCMAACVR